jgi:hypothetical protein
MPEPAPDYVRIARYRSRALRHRRTPRAIISAVSDWRPSGGSVCVSSRISGPSFICFAFPAKSNSFAR